MKNREEHLVQQMYSTSARYYAWLGLLAAAFLLAVSFPFLFYRVINEDRVLRSQLSGYADYAQRVCWRLVPGIW